MFETDDLEIWNLKPGVSNYAGAQKIFNVLGRLKLPQKVSHFIYSFNGGKESPVFFNRGLNQNGRLQKPGDFNLDTIRLGDLKPDNEIIFRVIYDGREIKESKIAFTINHYEEKKPHYRLDLKDIEYPFQVGQMIDGHWQMDLDSKGEPFLGIREENAGFDRIILFGHHNWTNGYEIKAKLCVTSWIKRPFNVGLLYKWNSYPQGDGASLPTQWSTGHGYYCSYHPGLRIRFGVNVHLNEKGNKVGSFVLKKKRLSLSRVIIGKIVERRYIRPIAREIFKLQFPFAEIAPGVPYFFRMMVHPQKYALTVWKCEKKEPSPQLVVLEPNERLLRGSLGIVAHHCAVRLYKFNVDPVK
jgi:hypothetical protein